MTILKASKVVALASVCVVLPIAAAQAQDNGNFDISDVPPAETQTPVPQSLATSIAEVTLGAGGVSQSSTTYGRYNGMPDSGIGVVSGWNLQNRDAWDSGGTHHYSFTGDNINFGFGEIAPEASVNLKIGDQGQWGISASYDAMTYTATDHFTTILDKKGNLAPGYEAALAVNGAYLNNSPTSSSFYSDYGPDPNGIMIASGNHVGDYGPNNELIYKIGTRRDKASVAGDYELGSWKFTADISREHKEGTLEQTMTTEGDNTGIATFPMPINYDTDNYTVGAAYNTPDLQASLTYEFSNFIDHNKNGYAFEGWNFTSVQDQTTLNYTSYQQSGVYSLPPSNQAHTVTAEIGYNMCPTTQLNGTVVYGLQLQNDPFVAATRFAYTLNDPTMSAQIASNPKSLNGVVQTFFGNVAVNSRPLPKLDLRASYTIDVRDPQTKSMWIYGDLTDTTSLEYHEAVPESWTKQEVTLSAGYHILPSTRVTVGYTFRDDWRGNAITHHAQDNEELVKIYSTLATNVTASLGYVHANRSASAPDYSLWYTQIASDCGGPTVDTLGCQQVPFYEAARTKDVVTGMVTGMIGQKILLSLFAKYSNDKYHVPNAIYNGTTNPSVGINRDYNIQVGPDLSYQVDKDSEVHAFYTFLRTYRAIRGLNEQDSPTTPGGNYFSEASTYDIHTAGIGGTWRASDKLKFGADYIYSCGTQGFAQSGSWDTMEAGQTFGGDPFLSTQSTDHQFKVHAAYDYSPDLSFYLSYRFDSLDTTDWALVGASVGQVLTGDVPPKYNVSTVMAAMTVKL